MVRNTLQRSKLYFCNKKIYILFDDVVCRQMRTYEILAEGEISSTSDHLPIYVSIEFNSKPHIVLEQCYKLTSWHRITDAQIDHYQKCLVESLNALSVDIESGVIAIDSGCEGFVSVVLDASECVVPKNETILN